jgi:Cupin-like domain
MELQRRESLDPQEFRRDYLVPRVPVIVTGAMRDWRAPHRWTWDFLLDRFGDREVDLFDDWFVPTGTSRFSDFVRRSIGVPQPDLACSYVRWFSRHSGADGRWADEVFAGLQEDWSHPAFLPASDYVVPLVPADDRISATTHRFPYRGLFISARGARTRLHLDPWASSAVLCQVAGVKSVALHPPEQHETILAAVTAGDADVVRTSAVRGAPPAYENELLSPGEILFIPAGWWHHVTTLGDSVSVTWNFVHADVAEPLLRYTRAHPSDPELEVTRFFLSGLTDSVDDAEDTAALVAAAMAARDQASTAVGGEGR